MLLTHRFYNFKKNIFTYIELNRLIIFPVAIFILFEYIFFKFNMNELKIFSSIELQSFHFNVLSINAVIAGFLFTGLSILISVSNKKIVKLLNKGGYLSIIDKSIYLGIFSHLSSIAFSFVCMINTSLRLQPIFTNIQFLSFLLGIAYFFMSIIKLKTVIDNIRKEDLKGESEELTYTEKDINLLGKIKRWAFFHLQTEHKFDIMPPGG